jgi:glycosyltransferase involved in cell wall biosynthesis
LRDSVEQPPQLLLSGKRGWLYDSLFSMVRERNLGDLIKFADYVERGDLPALYAGALALTFPSLYEGFGLPALEAMSCGTPVLAANATSLPEVVGGAGILLDPNDPQAWVSAVNDLLANPDKRHDLSARGLAQASRFSWERCAAETWAVLKGL